MAVAYFILNDKQLYVKWDRLWGGGGTAILPTHYNIISYACDWHVINKLSRDSITVIIKENYISCLGVEPW